MIEARQFTIRQAKIDDLPLLVEWTLKLHKHEDDGTLQTHPEFHTKITHWITLEIENPASLYLIAESNGNAIGFLGASQVLNDNGFLLEPTKGIIQLLWIEAEWRKSGVADGLVSEVESCFRNIGVRYVECTFTSSNQLAKNFWSKKAYQNFSISARKFL